jgi:hypothetical protein
MFNTRCYLFMGHGYCHSHTCNKKNDVYHNSLRSRLHTPIELLWQQRVVYINTVFVYTPASCCHERCYEDVVLVNIEMPLSYIRCLFAFALLCPLCADSSFAVSVELCMCVCDCDTTPLRFERVRACDATMRHQPSYAPGWWHICGGFGRRKRSLLPGHSPEKDRTKSRLQSTPF